jgi:hypothetical protein
LKRLPPLVLGALVAATVAAFFVTQHLKVTTPLIAGFPAPDPAVINPLAGGKCNGVSHRVTRVSFYLKHRSDDVDVYVIDRSGAIVATVATGRHMQGGARPVRMLFSWDGREDNGQFAPDGTYFFEVALIHQGRIVVISNTAGPEPITVITAPPHPTVTGVSPALIPQPGLTSVRIGYSGDEQRGGYINLYRTDLPGTPRLVKTFGTPWTGHTAIWDGRIDQRPAPAGIYLVGVTLTDAACATGRFPSTVPPARGSTPRAGLTVRYLAAQPPLAPVAAGSKPLVFVDSRRRPYRWSLGRVGAAKAIASGAFARVALGVPIPARRAGLYELTLSSGPHSTTVPLVASAAGAARVLVVLPALTWQGLNEVDDNGDGIPNTLADGGPIALARPLAGGLPAGFSDEAEFLAYLESARHSYELTTDLGLIDGVGPSLAGHAAVVLAGSERWLPPALATALRAYVRGGGHLLSLGIDSLRRAVTVRGGLALNPTPPSSTDALGAKPGALVVHNRDLIAVIRDGLGIFQGTSGAFAGFSSFQPIAAPTPVLSEAGTSGAAASIVGYRSGAGIVVEIGLPGFGSILAHNLDAQELVNRLWTVLG